MLHHLPNHRPGTSRAATGLWPRHFSYRHVHCTQASDPAHAEEARRIIGHGRIAMDTEPAGAFATSYVLALNDLDPRNRAAVCIHHTPAGGSFRDLPGYAQSRFAICAVGLAALDRLQVSGVSFREIAALDATPGASPLAALGLLRSLVQDAQDEGQAWLLTGDVATQEFFTRTLGRSSCMALGEQAPCPSLVFPSSVIDDLARAVQAEESPLARHALGRTLLFLTQGLDEAQLGTRACTAVAMLRNGLGRD